MSKVYADAIEPVEAGNDITLGAVGDTVTLAGNDLRVNTIKDSGGNTLMVSDGSGNVSSLNRAFAGDLKLLSTQTGSGVDAITFRSGIDSTYKLYIFKFYNINPANDNVKFQFNGSFDGNQFGIIHTSTYFDAQHNENGGAGQLNYKTNHDAAQITAWQPLSYEQGNGSDECLSGELQLFNPSNTTYVKHFTYRSNYYQNTDYSISPHVAGYFNTTTAITGLSFRMNGGLFDGTIKMYGLA